MLTAQSRQTLAKRVLRPKIAGVETFRHRTKRSTGGAAEVHGWRRCLTAVWVGLVAIMLAACGGSTAAPAASSSSAAASSAPASAKPSASSSSSSAVAKASASSSSAAKASQTSLNAAYVSISSHTLPIWIASSQKFFEQQGLNVHVSYVQGSVTAIPALASGDISMLEATPAASVQAQLKGDDTVVLATHIPYADYRLMVVPSIHTLDDLRGKTLGASKAGTVDDVVIEAVLKEKGLIAHKDYQISYLGTQPAQIAAIGKGLVQATPLSPPNNLAAEKVGAHELLNVLDMHYPYPTDGIISSRKFVREHPDTVVAFLKAYVQAIRFIKANPEETIKVMASYTKNSDAQVNDLGYKSLLADLADNPVPALDGIKTVLPLFKGEGKNPADFVDAEPLKKAMQELGG